MKKAIVMLLLAAFSLSTYAAPVLQQDTTKHKKEKKEKMMKKWKKDSPKSDTMRRDTNKPPKM